MAQNTILNPIVIEQILVRTLHTEIICKSEEVKTIIKKLQKHKVLKQKINLLTETVPNHKMILLGVPAAVDLKFVQETITSSYVIQEDNIKTLTALKNKHTEVDND